MRTSTAIIIAALIMVIGPITYYEVWSWRAGKAVDQFAQDMEKSIESSAQQAREQSRQIERNRVAADRRLLLSRNQRCVSGTVVDTSPVNGTPSFRQVLEDTRPVRCVGNSRLH